MSQLCGCSRNKADKVSDIDSSGVGYSHCSYVSSRLEIYTLLMGNVLVVLSYIIEKIGNRD